MIHAEPRRLAAIAILALAFAAHATPSLAQQPVSFEIGGGPIFPSGEVSNRFDTGYTIPVGFTWNVNNKIGVQFQYFYASMGGPEKTFPGALGSGPILIESNHQMHSGTFNVVFQTSVGGVSVYGVTGPGFYHRSIDLTTPSVGFVTICDPYWLICYPAAVSVDQVVGSRSTTDFGFNVGGGVRFGPLFVEVRYHYVVGPEFDTPVTGVVKANGHYVPINIGFRF